MATPASTKIAAIKRAARHARTSQPAEERGEFEDRAESSQYETGEEGGEPGPNGNVGRMTPRPTKRPF